MLSAMSSGHDGSLSTVHAGSPAEALRRVETLALMAGLGLPHEAIREQVAGALDLVVHQARMPGGARCVVAVSEVVRVAGGAATRELYALRDGRPTWRAPLGDAARGPAVARHGRMSAAALLARALAGVCAVLADMGGDRASPTRSALARSIRALARAGTRRRALAAASRRAPSSGGSWLLGAASLLGGGLAARGPVARARAGRRRALGRAGGACACAAAGAPRAVAGGRTRDRPRARRRARRRALRARRARRGGARRRRRRPGGRGAADRVGRARARRAHGGRAAAARARTRRRAARPAGHARRGGPAAARRGRRPRRAAARPRGRARAARRASSPTRARRRRRRASPR